MESRINPPKEEPDKPKRKNIWIYIAIIVLLLATNIYLFLQRKNEKQQKLVVVEQLQQATTEKVTLQNEYNAALARLDQLTSQNTSLQNEISGKNSDLQQLKKRINQILSKSNATQNELNQARSLIASLNGKISGYEQQIAELKSENSTLTTQKDSVTSANVVLQKKVDIAKILHASNIRLQAIILRKGGRKESVTTKAKKVDLLRILFDIDQNMLTENGFKTFDIRIESPDGTLLSNSALGSGSFIDSKGQTQYFSLSQKVQLTSGMPLHNIDADWRQAASYQKGAYIVEIYNQGYLIGQGTTTLR